VKDEYALVHHSSGMAHSMFAEFLCFLLNYIKSPSTGLCKKSSYFQLFNDEKDCFNSGIKQEKREGKGLTDPAQ